MPLPNGLRYYVRANGNPVTGLSCGSSSRPVRCWKTTTSRGWRTSSNTWSSKAHGTFPRQGIVDFLSSLGLSIGPDANAATSYDDTQYTLRVPTDVPGVLDRALLVLEDWAQGASFDQSGIDRERGIVLSEWRMHLGAGERTADKIRRVQLEGSRYADRPPIGNPDIIEHAQREQLTRFYRDWYRPDLMAVIVVGDVDRDAVATMIKDHFSPLASPSPERPRPVFDVPEHPGTRYALVTDKETTATTVGLSDLRPARNQGSVGGYRELMRDQLFADMLGGRLDELSQSANPPFLRAAADRALFPAPRTRDEAVLQALVSNDGVARGLDALVTELQRVARFGFTATELARAKQTMMLSYERARRKARTVSPRAAPMSTRGIFSRKKRCQRSGRSSRSTGGSSQVSRWPRSTRSAGIGSPTGTGSLSCPRRTRPALSCPIRRSSPRPSRPPWRSGSSLMSTPRRGRRSWTRRLHAARS